MIACRYCGTKIPKGSELCLACGRQLVVPALERGGGSEDAPMFPLRETSTSRPCDPGASQGDDPPPFLAHPYPASPSVAPKAFSSPASPALLKGKSRLGRWFILGVLGLLLVGAGVGAFVYANRSTPAKTLQTACTASKSGDFQAAYDQFSDAFKSKVGDERTFADGQQQFFKSRGGFLDCTVTKVNEEGASASATIILMYGDGSMLTDDLTLIEEHGGWKILSANIRA